MKIQQFQKMLFLIALCLSSSLQAHADDYDPQKHIFVAAGETVVLDPMSLVSSDHQSGTITDIEYYLYDSYGILTNKNNPPSSYSNEFLLFNYYYSRFKFSVTGLKNDESNSININVRFTINNGDDKWDEHIIYFIHVTSSILPDNFPIYTEETDKLQAESEGTLTNLTWNSSNASVVKVISMEQNSSTLEGVSVGSAQISISGKILMPLPWASSYANFSTHCDVTVKSSKKTVNVSTAGTLSNYINEEEKYHIKDLTIKGIVNSTDFRLLRDMAGNDCFGIRTDGRLSVLDLRETNIIAGGEKYLETDFLVNMGGNFNYSVEENDNIPEYLFCGCILTKIYLPNETKTIKKYALAHCSNLNTVILPEGLEQIQSSSFFSSGLTSIDIPKSVEVIDKNPFSACWKFSTINVADGNQHFISINGVLFDKSKTILKVYPTDKSGESYIIPSSVKEIGSSAFIYNSSLKDVVLPEGLTTIANWAFSNCKLTKIELPSSVNQIGYGAFRESNDLMTITSNISQPFNLHDAEEIATFSVYQTATLYVPYDTKIAYQQATGWKNFQNIVEMEPTTVSVNQITLNAQNKEIAEGQTFQLSATVLPSNATNKNVTWTSSNASVATVDSNGQVTGIGGGNAVITCEAQDGSGVKATCNVKVEVLATEMTLNASNIVLAVGQTFRLSWTVIPSNATFNSLKWSSDNTSVATVTQFVSSSESSNTMGGAIFVVEGNPGGLVTALAPGSATITCLVQDGSGVSATCNVIVKESTGDIIQFADAEVKRICVENWDMDGDGELSEDEAASVTSIGTVFRNNNTIESFTELEYFTGLTTISDWAFGSCSSLRTITFPPSLTSIGSFIFYGSKALTTITIPKSVTSIGEEMLEYTEGLGSIIVENGNTVYDSRNGCNAIIQTATNTLIAGCKNSTIPNSVTSIGKKAFALCSNLANISIPSSVKSIGEYAFQQCKSLSSITLPSGITRIEQGTFYVCSSLATANIPNGVTMIGDRAFWGCGFTNIELPSTLKTISSSAFYQCKSLTSVDIPEGVTSIGSYAFGFCDALSSISIPKSVTSIAQHAFRFCPSLTEVTSYINPPYNITDDVFEVYDDNYNIVFTSATLYVPAGTKTKYQAAAGWTNFQNIVEMEAEEQPDLNFSVSVYGEKKVGEQLYLEVRIDNNGGSFTESTSCYNYIEGDSRGAAQWTGTVTIPKYGSKTINYTYTPTKPGFLMIDIEVGNGMSSKTFRLMPIESDSPVITFADTEVKRICVENWDTDGDGDLSLEEAAAVTSLNTVFKSNRNITSFNELQYFTGLEELDYYEFYSCSNLESIIIPDNITTIKSYAFNGCSSLTDIELPNSLVYLYDYAFTGCDGLTSVTIPKNVYAKSGMVYCSRSFSNCKNLAEIIVAPENPYLESIDNVLYTKDHKAIMQYPAGKRDAEFVIPEGVTYLAATFIGCEHLTSVKIPESVTLLNGPVFQGCTGLTEIEIPQNASFTGYYFINGCTNLTQVVSHIMEPEDVDSRTFEVTNGVYPATLYVAAGTKSLYEQCEGWCEFQNIVEMGADVVSGDANGDGDVNVTDYMAIANYILGLNYSNFNVTASDVNGDGDVNVTDYVGVANIILYGRSQGTSVNAMMALNADESSTWMEMEPTKDGKINLLLHNVKPFSAFQMDIQLPDGVEIVEASMAKANQTKNLGYTRLQNGTWRLLYGTLENKAINLLDDTLLTLELACSKSNAGGLVSIDHIILVKSDTSTIQLDAVQGGLPTGIYVIESGSSIAGDSYDLTGRKVDNSQLKKGVYVVNGKKLYVK